MRPPITWHGRVPHHATGKTLRQSGWHCSERERRCGGFGLKNKHYTTQPMLSVDLERGRLSGRTAVGWSLQPGQQ